MQEVWKPIKGFEGLYEVSNFGRIKNRHGRILKPRLYDNKYLYVILYRKQAYKNFRVHRITAQTFIPNPLNFPEVNHKDGNKLNNNCLNLEWCTRQENIRHSNNILGNSHCRPIMCLETRQIFNSIKNAAKFYNIDPSSLTKHLKGKYKISCGYHWKYL